MTELVMTHTHVNFCTPEVVTDINYKSCRCGRNNRERNTEKSTCKVRVKIW
jgi:hypothetical protein